MEADKEDELSPIESNLESIKLNIIKFQNEYFFTAKDILSGNFIVDAGRQILELSGQSYLEIAKTAIDKELNKIAEEWINEILIKCLTVGCRKDIHIRALQYKAYIFYKRGEKVKAWKVTKEILKHDPENLKAQKDMDFFNFEYNLTREQYVNVKDLHQDDNDDELALEHLRLFSCGGFLQPDVNITSQLKCHYVHFNNPYLRLAPVKEEELYLDPRIVSYKQIISDAEIEIVKKIASPRLKISETVNGVERVRVSKTAWLEDNDNKTVEILSRRVGDITGMDTTNATAEQFQVVNYGIGGHYGVHHDYLDKNFLSGNPYKESFPKPAGDRTATFLMYLNEVESGGGTVFPLLKLLVRSEKGAALLWYNLDASGDYDERTLHSGCPVLEGQKWIANKWIHEVGQIFKKPCPKDYKKHTPGHNFTFNS